VYLGVALREGADMLEMRFLTDARRELKKDVQTVTPDRVPVAELTDGVVIRPQVTRVDSRGVL
jgi:hypothetical protein